VSEHQIELQYENDPAVLETFAEDLEIAFVQGNTLRLVFTVTRIDLPIPAGERGTGKRVPTCRVIMPAASLGNLARKINEIAGREVARA
jgi:hypothetical protein